MTGSIARCTGRIKGSWCFKRINDDVLEIFSRWNALDHVLLILLGRVIITWLKTRNKHIFP